jgi:Spy/CpxP family protein refolding chaperone
MVNKTLIFLIFSSLSFFGTGAVAQEDRSEESRAKHHLERLTEDLSLNEQQIEQVSIIMESQKEERNNAHEKHHAAREEMQALRTDFRNQISEVLSAEQLETFDGLENRRKNRHSNEKRHRKGSDKARHEEEE